MKDDRNPFVRARNHKSGLAVPVLCRNLLHDAIRERSRKDADPRRVTCKECSVNASMW